MKWCGSINSKASPTQPAHHPTRTSPRSLYLSPMVPSHAAFCIPLHSVILVSRPLGRPHVSTATRSGNNLNFLNVFKWLEARVTDTQLNSIDSKRELMHPIYKPKSPMRARFHDPGGTLPRRREKRGLLLDCLMGILTMSVNTCLANVLLNICLIN